MSRFLVTACLLALPAAVAGSSLVDSRQALIEDPLRFELAAPVPAEKMREAIRLAAGVKNWQVTREADNHTQLSFNNGRNNVRIGVRHDGAVADIILVDSVNMLYREKRGSGYTLRAIHRNYNTWVRELAAAIASIAQQPMRIVPAQPPTPMLSATNFALAGDAAAVPFLDDTGREHYREWLRRPVPSAFVIAPNGVFAAAAGGRSSDDPIGMALDDCGRRASGCRVYAVDRTVVWSRE